MADNTIIQTGRFTSDGTSRIIPLRGEADWIKVWNETAANQAAADLGYKFMWRTGMAVGRGQVWTKLGAVANDPITVGQIAALGGFTYINTFINPAGAPVTITNIATGAPPRVTAAAHGLQTGDTVRLSGITGGAHLGGTVYEVIRIDANNFDLAWMPSVAVIAAPGAAAAVRNIGQSSSAEGGRFFPRPTGIASVATGATTTVTLTADVGGGFIVGSVARFHVPSIYDMTQLDGLQGNVTAVSAANNTITVDIDSSAFTAFAFPTNADVVAAGGAFTQASVTPVGEDGETYYDSSGFPDFNANFIGFELAGGTLSPAGQNNDVIYWEAGRGFSDLQE